VDRTHHAAGRWTADHRVVVLHSGGVPALFAYHAALAAHLARRD
jgi:1-aminocyclopropane-1-carboxylate deaminase/D-cysteine desulfhydrase-like pyridoxal-dependent ACC family enzyme